MSDFLSLGARRALGENIPTAMVDLSNGPKDVSIETFGKVNSVTAVGLRAMRHHGAIYVLLANSTGKEVSASLRGCARR